MSLVPPVDCMEMEARPGSAEVRTSAPGTTVHPSGPRNTNTRSAMVLGRGWDPDHSTVEDSGTRDWAHQASGACRMRSAKICLPCSPSLSPKTGSARSAGKLGFTTSSPMLRNVSARPAGSPHHQLGTERRTGSSPSRNRESSGT